MRQTLRPGEHFTHTAKDAYSGAVNIDWCQPIGQPGYPWASGTLYLEHVSDLEPLEARGYGGPGKYHKAQFLPQVRQALMAPVKEIASTPLRIERPDLAEWMGSREEIVAERHWQLCQRVWYSVTRRRKDLAKFIRETILGAAVDGFYLGEIICDEQVHTFEGLPMRYWIPRLPERRAAWTVRYWLTQRERPVGVILDASQAHDYGGSSGPSWSIVPWRKLIHVAADQQGSNLEGVSWLRPLYNIIKKLQEAYQLEALATEVNGVGELHFILPPNADGTVKDAAELHLKRRKAGQAAGGVWPEGTQVLTISPQTTLPDFGPMKTGLSQDIQLGLDSTDAQMGQEQVGSYAARKEAGKDRMSGYDYITQQYVSNPLEDLMERAICINYPGDVAQGLCFTPSVAYGAVDERDNDVWMDSAAIATALPGVLTDADRRGLRQVIVEDILRLPQADDINEGGSTTEVDPQGREVAPDPEAGGGVDESTKDAAEAIRDARLAGLLTTVEAVRWARDAVGMPPMTPEEEALIRAQLKASSAASAEDGDQP